MRKMLLSFFEDFRKLVSRECGQDLVEYALVVAMIAFGAVAGMRKVATAVDTAFSNVSTQLGTDIS
jgi:pilus assembly protein Flp/PilA